LTTSVPDKGYSRKMLCTLI